MFTSRDPNVSNNSAVTSKIQNPLKKGDRSHDVVSAVIKSLSVNRDLIMVDFARLFLIKDLCAVKINKNPGHSWRVIHHDVHTGAFEEVEAVEVPREK